jgi:hypothetical protein
VCTCDAGGLEERVEVSAHFVVKHVVSLYVQLRPVCSHECPYHVASAFLFGLS